MLLTITIPYLLNILSKNVLSVKVASYKMNTITT